MCNCSILTGDPVLVCLVFVFWVFLREQKYGSGIIDKGSYISLSPLLSSTQCLVAVLAKVGFHLNYS